MIQAIAMNDFTLIVSVLAATDVLWVAFRGWHRAPCGSANAVGERRATYRRGGLVFTGGGTGARRQERSRELDEARRAKLIAGATTTRPLIRLTDDGFAVARALAGCPFIGDADTWNILARVEALTQAGVTNSGCGPVGLYVPEYAILNRPHGSQLESPEVVGLENQAMPLLVAGLLEARSDCHGRVGYAITPEGRAALAAGPPAEPEGLPAFDEVAAELYNDGFFGGLKARNHWEPEGKDLAIPLSAGLWPAFQPEAADDA
jgi:hypothetical protein